MLTKYGLDVLLIYSALVIVTISLTFIFIESANIRYSILAVVVILSIFTLNFFRDPERKPPDGNKLVLAPADGKIILIKEIFESDYLKQDAVQVSIFMSPLNVHVNRFPISGIVEYFQYIKGKKIVAFNDKSSEENERTLIGIDDNGNKVLFKQIAGAVARRIVANVKVGQQVKMGERFGMIKFGSRVDVILPREMNLSIKLNNRVVAGETIIAKY